MAVCTASGRLRGQQVRAEAEILPDSETGAVERLIADKYRFDLIILRPLRFIQARLHLGRPRTKPAIPGITPGCRVGYLERAQGRPGGRWTFGPGPSMGAGAWLTAENRIMPRGLRTHPRP